ncbi:MAG TPA: hypothetical protein VGO11_12690 [Chthoniobacteraceae bacterium]|nr:hypothetical protein [Chthoniobacteraceae bacterium]
MDAMIADGDTFALTPGVLSEFVHVTTDPKRFAKPLPIATAVSLAEEWWTSAETEQLHTDEMAMDCFFQWLETYRLGRKRLHDTMFAAVLHTAGVRYLLTLNPSDFRVFGCFEFHPDFS